MLSARTAVVMGEFFHVAGVTPRAGPRARPATTIAAAPRRRVVLSTPRGSGCSADRPTSSAASLVARNHAFTIVGVMPADFEYPRGVEIWTTLTALADAETNRAFRAGLLRDVELLARLRPGVTLEQASSELASVMTRLDAGRRTATGGSPTSGRSSARYKDVVVGDIDRGAGRALRRGRPDPGDCRRQRRQPAADARRDATQRAGGAGGARRQPRPAGRRADRREPGGRAAGGGRRPGPVALEPADGDHAGARRAAAARLDPHRRAPSSRSPPVWRSWRRLLAGLVPALAASRIDLVAQLRAGGRGTTARRAPAADGCWSPRRWRWP